MATGGKNTDDETGYLSEHSILSSRENSPIRDSVDYDSKIYRPERDIRDVLQ